MYELKNGCNNAKPCCDSASAGEVLTVIGVSVLFSLLLGVPSLRLRGDYLAIVTLGFGLIIREVVQNLDRPPVLMGHQFGPSNLNITGGTGGIQLVDELTLPKWFPLIHGMALQQRTYYWIFLGFLALCVLCMLRWRNSRPGRAWIAIREDELAARAMGVNVFKYRLLAFSTSAAMAGLVGMIDAAYLHNAFPENFDVTKTILVFIMVVLGNALNLLNVDSYWQRVAVGAVIIAAAAAERLRSRH